MAGESPQPRPTPSYVHGVSDTPLRGLTVGQLLADTAARHAARDALIVPYENVRWTYAELDRRVDDMAAGLRVLGLVPGDRIGLWAPNRADWVVLQFATARAGLVLVNLNPAYRAPELAYALQQVEAKALITVPSFKSSDYLAMLAELLPELATSVPGVLASTALPALHHVIVIDETAPPGTMRLADVAAAASDADRQAMRECAAVLQFDAAVNIQFTSGTTGQPKAATLTHHNIVNNAWFTGLQMRLTAHDRLCIPVPMYHCFGMVLGTLCCVAHGAAMVLPSPGFDAEATVAVLESERCTALHGVPTMFIAALETPGFERRDLGALRTGIIAGAPCPVELMRRIIDEMHMTEITIAYGMTETGPVSTQTSVEDSLSRRVETVGRVLPHVEIKIVDDQGRVTPRGVAGELMTRGYLVMPKYWNDAERTAAAIDETHWIASGDIATVDEDGYVRIVGRSKDMLIRGGENIYPREIEEFLYTHPAIEQVEVIGVPDARYGEEVCAWIRLRDGSRLDADELREFCRDRIAHFKIPRYIRFVDAFPMTVTGKVQKFAMRESMARELAAAAGE